MDWANFFGLGATCVGALAAPIGVWVGLEQRKLAEAQLQDAGQIHLELVKTGSVVKPSGNDSFTKYELRVRLHGPGARHGVTVSLQTRNGMNYLGKPIKQLHAGSEPVTLEFYLREEELDSAILGVQWVGSISGKPMPQMIRMRVNDAESVEQWRWSRWALWLRDRFLRSSKNRQKVPSRRLGKWCRRPNLRYSAEELPGWPIEDITKSVGAKPQEWPDLPGL